MLIGSLIKLRWAVEVVDRLGIVLLLTRHLNMVHIRLVLKKQGLAIRRLPAGQQGTMNIALVLVKAIAVVHSSFSANQLFSRTKGCVLPINGVLIDDREGFCEASINNRH
jgi:hypothetical protein